jgi:hypothetical protein
MLYFDERYIRDGIVTLYKSYVQDGTDITIYGEVVDIFALESLVTFTNLA